MRRLSIFVFSIFLTACSFAQKGSFIYGEDSLQCIYSIKEGRFSGKYESFYKNGVKRSEGMLENGYRTGKWTVWDTLGKIRMERIYSTPFDFNRAIPAPPKDTAAALLFSNEYKMVKDSNGIIVYAKMKAEDAIWRHKYWRVVTAQNNKTLFENNLLLNAIVKQVKEYGIVVYDTFDDRFTTPLRNIQWLHNRNMQIESLQIKEECIFDLNRMCSEYRILGLCPVIQVNGQLKKLGWFYYPDLRKGFGKEIIKSSNQMLLIKTLDDLFVLRDFASIIVKTTVDNPYDLWLKDYPGITIDVIKYEQLKQEINIIEEEHNLWLSFTE